MNKKTNISSRDTTSESKVEPKFLRINRKKRVDTATVRRVVGGKGTKFEQEQHNEIFVTV